MVYKMGRKLTGVRNSKSQLTGAQKPVDVQFLAASGVPRGSVQELVLLNVFNNEQGDELECGLSEFGGDTKLLGADDTLWVRAAMEESHQSCYISILTTAPRCGLLISG